MAHFQDIHNSSLNNSTSKQQFSFSKSERFKRILKTEHIDVFYDLPSSIDKNAYSFSKGRRYKDVKEIRKKHSPQPPFYKLEGQFQKILKKRSGIKMSFGRQECKVGSIFKLSDNPGPGAYDPNPQFTESRISVNCSLGKINNTKRRIQKQDQPGPGKYEIKSSLLNQNKILSNDTKRSAGKLFFSTNKLSQRVKTEVQPQIRFPEITYRGERTIKKNAGHSLSKAARFKVTLINDTPGPGSQQQCCDLVKSFLNSERIQKNDFLNIDVKYYCFYKNHQKMNILINHKVDPSKLTLKEQLMLAEIGQMEDNYSQSTKLMKLVKQLRSIYNSKKLDQLINGKEQIQCTKQLINSIEKLHLSFTESHAMMQTENKIKVSQKEIQQQQFMAIMRAFQNKIKDNEQYLLKLQGTIQMLQKNEIESDYWRSQGQTIIPQTLQCLNDYISMQEEKKHIIHSSIQKGINKKNRNSNAYKFTSFNKNQYTSQTKHLKTQEKNNCCENVLLKEKVISEYLKMKVNQMKVHIMSEKYKYDQVNLAVRETNRKVNAINLELSVNSPNNFLLDRQNFTLHWKQMKQFVENRLKLGPSYRGGLKRSKSCSVMQSNQINDLDVSILFQQSRQSLLNEQSFLQKCDYFISQHFIKELVHHQL